MDVLIAKCDQMAIEALLSDFTWHADRGEGAALGALFLSDAVLTAGGVALRGCDVIAADCYRRSENPTRKTRHIWSNLRFEQAGDDLIATTIVQQTFEQNGVDQPTQLRLNDVTDTFRKNESGAWRFASRSIKREMALTFPA
ncbi:MAG TPA: nuclear transport factor 2 family protein [Bradyrhizobium sp.]|nr:nuclear transport factor 2 family protein [Bradyrhizobium sp.]